MGSSKRTRLLASALLAMLLASCGGSNDDARMLMMPVDSSAADRVLRDHDVGGSETHVFLPDRSVSGARAVPVVIMLHGTGADRSKLEPLAAQVAESGALVYVPTWPVIDQVLPYPEDEGDEPYRRQTQAVICVLRDVKRTAAEFDGDPDDITLVGYSGGAVLGAQVAIVAEPPWPGIDCDAGIDHRPDRFVGVAGDYEGAYQYGPSHPDLYGPYDVLRMEPTNRSLDVWLLHGQNDRAVWVRMSARFADHLAEAGIHTRFLTTDNDHVASIDTSKPAGRFTAARIVAIIDGRAEPQWWPQTSPDATMTLVSHDGCDYAGPETWPVDRAIAIRLENASDADAWFGLASVRSGAEMSLDEARSRGGDLDPHFEDREWLDWVGLRPVPAGEMRTLHFAFAEADQEFVLYCHRDPAADRPRAEWVPAATLAPSGASTSTSD